MRRRRPAGATAVSVREPDPRLRPTVSRRPARGGRAGPARCREPPRDRPTTVARHGIDCNWEETGELAVAIAEHEARRPRAAPRGAHHRRARHAAARRSRLASGGELADVPGRSLRDAPARPWWNRPAWHGVLGERPRRRRPDPRGTPATGLESVSGAMHVRTPSVRYLPRRVVLATNAFPPLLRRRRWSPCRSRPL